MKSSDEEDRLLECAVGGDPESTQVLFRSYYPRVLQYVRKRLPRELSAIVDAEDIVHDTFYEACRLIGGFRAEGEDSFFRWLATIARHRAIKLAQRHRRVLHTQHQRAEEEDEGIASLLDQLASHRRSPSGSAAAHEFMLSLEKAIGRLPPQYREVVQFRHLDGLSVAETASRMGKTNEAIYLLSCRALQAIRADLRSASMFA